MKSKKVLKPKVLNADQISDLGIKKGDRGYLNIHRTDGEEDEEDDGVGYLGMPPSQPYKVVNCGTHSPPVISGKSCTVVKETTLRVVLSKDYQKYVDYHDVSAPVCFSLSLKEWETAAGCPNRVSELEEEDSTFSEDEREYDRGAV